MVERMEMLFGKKQRRTLVVHVDDEPDICMLVQGALTPMGMDVLSASDGKTGLDLIIKENPDLVILDIMMPVMDGFTVCAALREHPNHKDTPIFLCTALSQIKHVEKASEIGATGYIIKPIDVDKLRHKVIDVLGPPHP